MSGIFSNDPTDDDDRVPRWGHFQNAAARELELLYSPEWHHFRRGETFAVGGGSICPDVAILVQGTKTCVCVADAKDRRLLEHRDVEKVGRYKRLLNAERAIVFVPHDCHVQTPAHAHAADAGVEIQRLHTE